MTTERTLILVKPDGVQRGLVSLIISLILFRWKNLMEINQLKSTIS
jgi:nucleoside diphosphate kinase